MLCVCERERETERSIGLGERKKTHEAAAVTHDHPLRYQQSYSPALW
jgi:hypothetical protein